MATILPFVIPRRGHARKPVPAGTATVIIFPGVRYERPQAKEETTRRPRRKRAVQTT
ncbi:MAG TPA: hypothetical protein PL183_03805 [Aquamicrobium sp.]|nr:hypothetical protein [Aquamicrobium sp.]